MKFVIEYFGGMPKPEDAEEHMKEWMEWIKMMKEKDCYIEGYPYSMEAKIVKGPDGIESDLAIDDQVDPAGYSLMEFRSWDEAVRASSIAPHMKNGGWVKLRECKDMENE